MRAHQNHLEGSKESTGLCPQSFRLVAMAERGQIRKDRGLCWFTTEPDDMGERVDNWITPSLLPPFPGSLSFSLRALLLFPKAYFEPVLSPRGVTHAYRGQNYFLNGGLEPKALERPLST